MLGNLFGPSRNIATSSLLTKEFSIANVANDGADGCFTRHFDNISVAHINSYDGKTMRDMSDMFRKMAGELDEDEKSYSKLMITC